MELGSDIGYSTATQARGMPEFEGESAAISVWRDFQDTSTKGGPELNPQTWKNKFHAGEAVKVAEV